MIPTLALLCNIELCVNSGDFFFFQGVHCIPDQKEQRAWCALCMLFNKTKKNMQWQSRSLLSPNSQYSVSEQYAPKAGLALKGVSGMKLTAQPSFTHGCLPPLFATSSS